MRRLILWVGLSLLIAGFIARRSFVPQALYYLTHRAPSVTGPGAVGGSPNAPASGNPDQSAQSRPAPPDQTSDARTSPPPAAKSAPAPVSEKLSDSDRRALDEVIRDKLK